MQDMFEKKLKKVKQKNKKLFATIADLNLKLEKQTSNQEADAKL